MQKKTVDEIVDFYTRGLKSYVIIKSLNRIYFQIEIWNFMDVSTNQV